MQSEPENDLTVDNKKALSPEPPKSNNFSVCG